jgi:hypothetical protein
MSTTLKKVVFAVVTTLATLLGGGQVWALDVTSTSVFSGAEAAIPGCVSASAVPGGVWHTETSGNSFQVRAGTGSSGGGGGSVIAFNGSGSIQLWGASSFAGGGAGGGGFISDDISRYCSNLSIVAEELVSPNIYGNTGFAAASFVGTIFTALDSTDSITYRYTVGFEGVTGSQGVFRRESLDAAAPTVAITGAPATVNNTTAFTVIAEFSETVTGFDTSDVTATNATVVVSAGPQDYTLTVTPDGSGDISLSILADAAQDSAGNDNTASATVVVGNTIVADTQKAISSFMQGRMNQLTTNQPGLLRFLRNDGKGSLSADIAQNAKSLDGFVSRRNFWVDLTGTQSGNDSYLLGSFGTHTLVNNGLVAGGMLQFDHAQDDANHSSGSGWLVGPYFAAKHDTQPLFYEGRLLFGQTDNVITPIGTFTDQFATERRLAQLRVAGEFSHKAVTLMPLLDFTYTDDTQKTYTDSLGNIIPNQSVDLMQMTAGMDFSSPISSTSNALDLTGGVSGIYSSASGNVADYDGLRGRVDLGLNYALNDGASLTIGSFYDGIGSDYESYGVTIGYNLKGRPTRAPKQEIVQAIKPQPQEVLKREIVQEIKQQPKQEIVQEFKQQPKQALKQEYTSVPVADAQSPNLAFWQVQVIASIDKEAILRVQKALKANGTENILVFEAPYYKLRVGPYTTKKATWAAQSTLRKSFEGAFAVKINSLRPLHETQIVHAFSNL